MDVTFLTFCGLAAVGLIAAVLMVTARNLVHAAIYLVAVFVTVAAVFVVLRAEFLAAVQVLVYAGGILVLYLFVIFLVDIRKDEATRSPGRPFHSIVSTVLVCCSAGLLGFHALARPSAAPTAERLAFAQSGSIETIATALFRHYLIPFEAISVLLLVAMVGAIVLARGEESKGGRGE